MTLNLARNSYDEVPYLSLPFIETHPDTLATVATLLGLSPKPLESCRVLELGCAGGGNLIPMAQTLPGSEFVGIDLSAGQIQEGRVLIEALGLGNIRLEHLNLMELDASFGQFDYIIAHGVYSWVPSPVRDRVLQICHEHLTPEGVAFVSYSTLPGWHLRGMVREMLQYHTRDLPDPTERVEQSRGFLSFLAGAVQDDPAAEAVLKSELELIQETPDTFVLHDLLEEDNQPVYFHQFISHAGRHRLQYLGEAEFGTMLAENFPPKVAEALRVLGRDVIDFEQYLDFLYCRRLRKTLLCPAEAQVSRNLRPDLVVNMYVASGLTCAEGTDFTPGTKLDFQAPGGGRGLQVAQPFVAAALLELAEQWPCAVPFRDVLEGARARLLRAGVEIELSLRDVHQLAATLLKTYASGLTELHLTPSPFALEPGERPTASPLARLQATGGVYVTSLAHRIVQLEPVAALLVPFLDGTRDRPALIALLEGWTADGTLQGDGESIGRDQLEAVLDDLLQGLVREALLVRE